MPSSNQCAVGTDENLLDESKIVWYNDTEDLVPIVPAAASSWVPWLPSTSSALKATILCSFFNGASTPGPAVFVAGTHHSSRVTSHILKPSKCILDVNNVELQAESNMLRLHIRSYGYELVLVDFCNYFSKIYRFGLGSYLLEPKPDLLNLNLWSSSGLGSQKYCKNLTDPDCGITSGLSHIEEI